ncbi:MAG TPA: hypothetical protein VGI88_02385, partial [Verrucomicrobiae bacterium]
MKMFQSIHARESLRKSVRSIGFLPLFLALMAASTTVQGADPDSSAPQTEVVAPGIWRLHFGDPEQLTPTHFRSAPMASADLEKMPFNQPMPLDLASISFQVSERGCSLQFPMKPGENVASIR